MTFTRFVKGKRLSGQLIVQPRMGFGTREKMREGLLAVKNAQAPTIGTVTLDSYTRVNRYDAAQKALEKGHDLNGYPLVTHGAEKTREMLSDLQSETFPIQVRHGTALPLDVFKTLLASGIDATEGGPVSYCLPYSRIPLSRSIAAWAECCDLFADSKVINHLESFAGCMLGQLCPPSLLIALGILEGLFFQQHGIKSLSLSFAQGTNSVQDLAALRVLRQLAEKYFSAIEWHIVVYTYMGVFPKTVRGAFSVLEESARVAKQGEAERLIVKTPAEAHRIPTIEENVASLEMAYLASQEIKENQRSFVKLEDVEAIHREAQYLVELVLDLHGNIGQALSLAFSKGYLDVPYCLHQDNRNKTRTYIDLQGYLRWADQGDMPFPRDALVKSRSVTSAELLKMLRFNQKKYDDAFHRK